MGTILIPTLGGPMRRLSTYLVPAAAAGLLAALMPAGAASAAPVVQPELFGQHVAGIASGAPDVPHRLGRRDPPLGRGRHVA